MQQYKQYLFIDGAYLRERVKNVSRKYFGETLIEIDFSNISSGFEKTFYYDCITPKGDELEEDYNKRKEEQEKFFNHLRTINGFHVYEGTIIEKNGVLKQKTVDVMIAVHMLLHSFHKNMERAVLLAGDLDFKPLIDELIHTGMYVTLWYEKKSISKKLQYASDSSRSLNIYDFYKWSTKQFQEKHKLPYPSSSPSELPEEKYLIKKGKTENNDVIQLFKKDESYTIIYPDKANKGYYNRIVYADLNFLELFVKDLYTESLLSG